MFVRNRLCDCQITKVNTILTVHIKNRFDVNKCNKCSNKAGKLLIYWQTVTNHRHCRTCFINYWLINLVLKINTVINTVLEPVQHFKLILKYHVSVTLFNKGLLK